MQINFSVFPIRKKLTSSKKMLTVIRAYGQKSMIDLPEYKSLLIMDLITLHMRHIDTHISASSNSTKGLNKYPNEMSVDCSGVLAGGDC